MPYTMSAASLLLLVFLFFGQASAFGAGEVPQSSEFNGYVWRHGDIAEVLRFLPVSFATLYRFTKLQRKQIYFGNWLRDFSQVIDTTCLETVPEPVLRAIVAIMAYMEFGFATDEFEVTRDRLGCYRHEEHIDNPKGYVDDAKKVDPRLRGPVDPRELEFDPRTGMKNYIANSGQGWTTSADYIRDQLKSCIELGRKKDHAARKASFIHLGAALHTLEDFSAHSNFTELCLRELGEDSVFAFVGGACRVEIPHEPRKTVPPLVTGTFGMLDIFHSLLGEADDMAVLQSKGSLGELEEKLNLGTLAFDQLFDLIKTGIETLGASAGGPPLLEQLETVRLIFQRAQNSSNKNSETTAEAPEQDTDADLPAAPAADMLWQSLEPLFYFHDRLSKWLQEGEDQSEQLRSGGSSSRLGDYSNMLVFNILAGMVEASVKELRNAVYAAKRKVDEEAAKSECAEVYADGSASDPSHSDLSKDHFSNVLNQPSGLVATVTTNWVTQQVVECWDKPRRNVDEVIDDILSILHHPAFPQKKTLVQQYMFDTVKSWWENNSPEEQERLRSRLTKESVQNRQHEDHKLTLKDFEGKINGAAEFPGSRPRVRAPPAKKSAPMAWAVDVAILDFNLVVNTLKKSVTSPGEALSDTIRGVSYITLNAPSLVFNIVLWVPMKVGQMAYTFLHG